MAGDKTIALRPFGWQGIELALPADWELSAYDGRYRAGYVRVDDGVQVRLHVQWNQERRSIDSLVPAIERYRKNLERKLRHSVAFDVLEPDFLPEGALAARQASVYTWTGKHSVLGLASYCRGCGRVTFAEVFSRGERDNGKLARRVLASLTDHGDGGSILWSVYGFAFRIPAPYTLVQPVLMPGRLQFLFQAARRQWLRVERWTLASPTLETLPMDAWPKELLGAARLRSVGGISTVADAVGELEACRFETRVAEGMLRKTEVTGLVWRDPDAKKVFAVIGGRTTQDAVRRIADEIRCY